MNRILFVDDEPNVLEGIENLLFPYMDEWDMDFASSGAEALDMLAEDEFDVIVTDMRMPGMDGAALLERVHDRFPRIVRIVLSGHSELEAAMRAMPIAHQFLSKPCSAETLIGVLNRACGLNELIGDKVLRGLVGQLGDLPARPQVYSECVRLLADDNASLADIAAVVEQDIGISTKILQVVNTAFFSRGNTITSVPRAVPRLGANFVKDLVLAVEVFRDLSGDELAGFSIDDLHDHSFLTASIAKRLLDDPRQADDAFLAGTLHDTGKLILATSRPKHFAQSLQEARGRGVPLHVAERELVGVTHAEVGAYLLGLWGLSYPVMDAVANHHHPQRSSSDSFGVVGAVHVANALAHGLRGGDAVGRLDMAYLQGLGLADRLEEWSGMADQVVEEAT